MLRFLVFILAIGLFATPAHADMTQYPKVRLRSIDKITARTMTFDAVVGTTIKFGSIYIKIQSCQKPDLQERPEAAAFLQIWEITPEDESKWVFSGWMFASSPAVSGLVHPIYDVWVIDCLDDAAKKIDTPKPDDINDVIDKTAAPPPPETAPDQDIKPADVAPAPENTH